MPAPRILILGATGGLGRALHHHLASTGHEVIAWGRSGLDLEHTPDIARRLAEQDFDVLLNAAGLTSPDVCEAEPARARQLNAEAPRLLAEGCQARGARLVHFSTDYVFSGEGREVWSEQDETAPVNTYGQTKLAGEQAVLQAAPAALVARVSWLFGPWKASHPDSILRQALESPELTAVADKFSAPTSQTDICRWTVRLLREHPDACGVLHLCNSGSASWHTWAEAALETARRLGVPVQTTRVRPVPLASLAQLRARRPLLTQMSNARLQNLLGAEIRPWQEALEEYLVEKYAPAR